MGSGLRLDRFFRQGEVRRFFRYVKGVDSRYFHLFLLMAFGGLRVGEACRVNVADFLGQDFCRLSVVNSKTANRSKGLPARVETIVLPVWLGRMVRRYVTGYGGKFKHGFLFFPDGHGSRNFCVGPHAVRMFLVREREVLGGGFVEPILKYRRGGGWVVHYRLSTHSFRRWFGTQVYRITGNDLKAASVFLRHRDVETTQVYVDGFAYHSRIAGVMAKLPKLL